MNIPKYSKRYFYLKNYDSWRKQIWFHLIKKKIVKAAIGGQTDEANDICYQISNSKMMKMNIKNYQQQFSYLK